MTLDGFWMRSEHLHGRIFKTFFATRWACEFFHLSNLWVLWNFLKLNLMHFRVVQCGNLWATSVLSSLRCSMTIEDLPLLQIVPHELRNLPFIIEHGPLCCRYLSKGVFGPSLSWLYDVAFTPREQARLFNGDSFGLFCVSFSSLLLLCF